MSRSPSLSNDFCLRTCIACCESLQRFLSERNLFVDSPLSQHQVRQLLSQVLSGNMTKIREETDSKVLGGLVLYLLKNMPTSILCDVQSLYMATDLGEDPVYNKEAIVYVLQHVPQEKLDLLFIVVRLLSRIASTAQDQANSHHRGVTMMDSTSYTAVSGSLSFFLAPFLCRPPNTAFMSLKHKECLPKARALLGFLVDTPAVLTGVKCTRLIPSADSKAVAGEGARMGGAKAGGRLATPSPLVLGEGHSSSAPSSSSSSSSSLPSSSSSSSGKQPNSPASFSMEAKQNERDRDRDRDREKSRGKDRYFDRVREQEREQEREQRTSRGDMSDSLAESKEMPTVDKLQLQHPHQHQHSRAWNVLLALIHGRAGSFIQGAAELAPPLTSNHRVQGRSGGGKRPSAAVGSSSSSSSSSAINGSSEASTGRRRMVAECKVLRQKIYQFEQGFAQQHGREPRSSERGAMAEAYVRYKDMKRTIRDEAARDIQRIFRGHVRRRQATTEPRRKGQRLSADEGEGGDLASTIGMDNMQISMTGSKTSSGAMGLGAGLGMGPIGMGAMGIGMGGMPPSSGLLGCGLGPQLGRAQSPALDAPLPPATATATGIIPPEALQQFRALQQEKRDVKRRLKRFDEDFLRDNGRAPRKVDKEVMRPVYQQYHEVKARLDQLRRDIESCYGCSPAETEGEDNAHDGFYNTSEDEGAAETHAQAQVQSRPTPSMLGSFTSSQAQPVFGGLGGAVAGEGGITSGGWPHRGDQADTGHSLPSLAHLQEEKRALHTHLKAYEREFQETYGRQVMHQEDILPVSAEYRRYKELKQYIKDQQGSITR